MQKHTEAREKQVGEIGNEMAGRFDLNRERQFAAPDLRQKFLAGLDRAFGPPMLLRLEAVHVHGQLRGRDHVGQKHKFPTSKLRAIAKIEIFRKRVVLPTTRVGDARFSPEPGGAVEIEKAAAATARGLFE